MSKINRPKIPVGFEYPVYKIIDIQDVKTGKRKKSARVGQYYEVWIGMIAFSMEKIDETCCGFPVVFHYMFDGDGHPMSGWMHTSDVNSVENKDGFIYMITRNSVYVLEEID